VHPFFEEHAARREKVRDFAESLILEDKPGSTEAEGGPPIPEL
jgi:hypothetical protein